MNISPPQDDLFSYPFIIPITGFVMACYLFLVAFLNEESNSEEKVEEYRGPRLTISMLYEDLFLNYIYKML